MAATHIRRTFQYPDSDSDDGHGAEMDEQEQEALIQHLHRTDETRNAVYKFTFTLLPCLVSLAFIPLTFSSTTTTAHKRYAGLSISSLLFTANMIRRFPSTPPGVQLKSPPGKFDWRGDFIGLCLTFLNATLCAFLAIVAYRSIDSAENVLHILYVIPGVAFFTVLIVRKLMASVDLVQLEKLRYEYKGA